MILIVCHSWPWFYLVVFVNGFHNALKLVFFFLAKTRLGVFLENPILPSVRIRCLLCFRCGLFKSKMGKFQVKYTFRFLHFHVISTDSSVCVRKSCMIVFRFCNLPVLFIFFLTVKHKAKCSICKEYPIVGFRFVVLYLFVNFLFFLFFCFCYRLLLRINEV